MTQLLATLDGSPFSEEILPVVGSLALGLGARLTLLTVVPYPSGTRASGVVASDAPVDQSVSGPAFEEVSVAVNPAEPVWAEREGQAIARAKDEGLEYLTRVTESMRVTGVDLNLEVAIEEDPAKAILESAQRNRVDYIAMCTHGRSGLNRLIHGSVTAAVINLSAVPILLVHPKG